MISARLQSERRAMRPLPADFVRPARFLWPTQARLLPRVCTHCGARLLVPDTPTAERPIADLDCWICSRTSAELIYDGTRPVPPPVDICACGERYPRGDRCEPCATRSDSARRMRQWRQTKGPRWSRDYDRCVACGYTDSAHHGHGRCNRCAHRVKRGSLVP